jgi:outer membrane receptor for ferrienterochelin and colicins
MIKPKSYLVFFLFISSFALAAKEVTLGEVLIQDEQIDQRMTPVDVYQSFKSEYVSQEKLSNTSFQSLADVLQNQRGVDAQVYCSNCGAKRVTINGLKGEHTSLLIDGLPLHSAISSFYGLDNIPMAGIKSIEVMRGTGASLTNPEAIGGPLNIQTINPLDFNNKLITSWGFDSSASLQSHNNQFIAGATSNDKKAGLVLVGQYSKTQTWDEDKNNISELPERENIGLMLKGRLQRAGKIDTSIRVSHTQLEILGGYSPPTKPSSVRSIPAAENSFNGERGDVDSQYVGDPLAITDWILMKRSEIAVNTTFYVNENTNVSLKTGLARQEQSSIYQHGFDYSNADNMWVADLNVEHVLNSSFVFTAGVFVKEQKLRSASRLLFEPPKDLPKDSFDYSSQALYTGLTFFFDDGEIDLAFRLDHLEMNWLELTNSIDKWVLAPRLVIRHDITHDLVQRFSYGLGYRAPLTFFESQHGNNEGGYLININKLEKSHSLVYSLSYNKPKYYITGSSHYTNLKNMAYGFESFNTPINYLNSPTDHNVWVADLLIGRKFTQQWLVELSIEHFNFDQDYKRKLPTAAIENRLSLKSSLEFDTFKYYATANVIFARDLGQYGGYQNHYKERNQAFESALDSTLTQKRQRAPTYLTLDSRLAYNYSKDLTMNFTVNNILGFTQAKDGDSPATWHWHFNHAHFDGLHTWGPNAGREFIFSLEYLL